MRSHPQPVTGGQRLGRVLVTVAAALGAFVVCTIIGFIGANQCDADGFTCLGWLAWGAIAGTVIAAAIIVLLGWRLGLGWLWGLITIAVAALATLPLPGGARAAVVALAPLVATLVTWPREPREGSGDRSGDGSDGGRLRGGLATRWWLIAASALVLLGVVVGSLVWKEHRMLTYRTDEYAASGVPVLGPTEPGPWEYAVVISGPPGRDLPPFIEYELRDQTRRRIQVDIRAEQDSDPRPPANCSTDPYRQLPCIETVPGVWRNDERPQRRFVVRDGAVAMITVFDGELADADLDALASSFTVHDARWLAARQSWLYRRLA